MDVQIEVSLAVIAEDGFPCRKQIAALEGSQLLEDTDVSGVRMALENLKSGAWGNVKEQIDKFEREIAANPRKSCASCVTRQTTRLPWLTWLMTLSTSSGALSM
jgi:hypothetical protein